MQQDHGPKNFMSRTGALNGDDIIDILVNKPVCAQFIGRKLWRFFVEDEPSPQIVDAIASSIRAHNYEMRPVLRGILFRSRNADANQESDSVFDPNLEAPRDATPLTNCRAKRDATNGPDSFRAAQCERLG